MNGLPVWAAVAGGGAVGALARHAVSAAALRLFGPGFPWGTLIVNAAGSFAMGLLVVWLAGREPNPTALRAFLAIGVLGAFTTFSTFSLELVMLYRERAFGLAALYLAASIFLSVGGLLAGLSAGRVLS
jgi:CrcB protein